MVLKRLIPAVIAVLASASAFAEDTHLGEAGSIVLTNGTGIVVDPVNHGVSLGVSGDVFALERLSAGVDLTVLLGRRPVAVLGARVGYVVPVHGAVSLWPRAEVERILGQDLPRILHVPFSAVFSLPATLTIAPHFFIGAGPTFTLHPTIVTLDSSGGSTGTALGFDTIIGGWF